MSVAPEDNIASLKAAHKAVAQGEVYISDQEECSTDFEEPEIVAVFSEPLNKLLIGRLLTFQKTMLEVTGAYVALKQATPGCFRAHFLFDMPSSYVNDRLLGYLSSSEFSELCSHIDISHVTYSKQVFSPKRQQRNIQNLPG